jgi:diguanylate cyclase (GGDEF)-like protein
MADKLQAVAPVFPKAVLLIDPAPASREKGAHILEQLGYEPRLAADVFEAHALIDGTAAVIAVHPAAADVYPRLRATLIPFIASLPSKERQPAALAHALGADAYVLRPYRKEALGAALFAASSARLLRDRAVRAERALANVGAGPKSRSESKSGLLHLDLFRTLLPMEIRRARRHGYPIAICVVSLDPLPEAQELTADIALACESAIRGGVRDVDLAVRYGEGRFLVFLPHTNAHGAEAVGHRILNHMRKCKLRIDNHDVKLSVSVGIATPRAGQPPSFSRLIRDAHAAVKAAQLKGGDRAILRA